jgi:hypothetical protein
MPQDIAHIDRADNLTHMCLIGGGRPSWSGRLMLMPWSGPGTSRLPSAEAVLGWRKRLGSGGVSAAMAADGGSAFHMIGWVEWSTSVLLHRI